MSVPERSEIRAGLRVQIVEKQNQRTGALTEGVVARILTKSPRHPHGIKGRCRGYFKKDNAVDLNGGFLLKPPDR